MTLHTPFLCGGVDLCHGILRAGKDDLARAIQVGHVDIALGGDLLRLFRCGAEQRDHRADRGIAGLLHQAAPFLLEVEPGLEGEAARRRVGGVFAEGEARRSLEAQGHALEVLVGGEDGQAVHIKSGLADARLG